MNNLSREYPSIVQTSPEMESEIHLEPMITRVPVRGNVLQRHRTEDHRCFYGLKFMEDRLPPRDLHRQNDTGFLGRIAIAVGDKIVLLFLSDVLWIQSKGDMVCLHERNADYDCRMPMTDIHKRLDPRTFLRVHRSAIVNLDHVAEFSLPKLGNAFAHLRNGQALPISRTGRSALRRHLLSQ